MESIEAFTEFLKNPGTPFGIFDVVYGVYFFYGLVRGMFRGLPEELAQLLGTVLMFYGAIRFYQPVSAFVIAHTRLEDPTASMALSYLLIFLMLMAAWKLLTYLLRKLLDWTCPTQLKRFGGGLIGLVKCMAIVVVILTAVLISGHQTLTTALIRESWFGREVQSFLPDTLAPASEPAAAESAFHGS